MKRERNEERIRIAKEVGPNEHQPFLPLLLPFSLPPSIYPSLSLRISYPVIQKRTFVPFPISLNFIFFLFLFLSHFLSRIEIKIPNLCLINRRLEKGENQVSQNPFVFETPFHKLLVLEEPLHDGGSHSLHWRE